MTAAERAAIAAGLGVGWIAGFALFMYWLNKLDGEWEI